MRDGLQVVHDSIEQFAITYRTWLTLAPAYSFGPALTLSSPPSSTSSQASTSASASSSAHQLPNAETLARAYCPISGPRWDEHRERIMASTSLKGLTVLRSQVEAELAALERLAMERGSWDEPHPYSNGTHHIRFWEEVLYVAFTYGPVLSVQDRFAFSMTAALRRKTKMRKPRGENVNSQSVKVDVVSQNGDRWTRLYIIKPERLRQEFREAESYMVDEDDSSSASTSEDDDLDSSSHTEAAADSFHEHQHTAKCSTNAATPIAASRVTALPGNASTDSLAFDVAAKKCSLTKLIHELRAAADTEAKARVQRSEEHGRQLPYVPIHVEIVVTRMELQAPSQPLPSAHTKGKHAALADFYQLSEWDRFNHRLAAIAQEAQNYNVEMVFGYRQLPSAILGDHQPPSVGLICNPDQISAKPVGLPSIPEAPARPQWRTTKSINLDVTAMIALVSDTTHGIFHESTAQDPLLDSTKRHPKLDDGEYGSGALYQHHFRTFSIRKEALEARAAELSLQDDQQDEVSRALDNAAAKEGRALAIQLEREMTVETLFDAILGPIRRRSTNRDDPGQATPVQIFATVGAFDRLRRVSSTVGGPNEKRRVKALLGDPGVDPQDFWRGSKWAAPEHDELRRCLILPIQPLQDLGPGGFESLDRLKHVYPDLPRAHFTSHMVDTLESCLTELWGPDWRDISEDLPRSKYKKLRQSSIHQAGGQTYTTLRSMHACARYGMTTITSNMDSVQWLLKEMSRRPYSEQTRSLLESASDQELEKLREQQGDFFSCFIVLHPRSLSEQMRVTTTAPAWREVLEGYPGGLGPPVSSAKDGLQAERHANGHQLVSPNRSTEEVHGYTIDDGQEEATPSQVVDRITSSNGIMYSFDPLARRTENEIETTADTSLPGSSIQSDSLNGTTDPDPTKKTSKIPLTPLSLQPEVEPIFYQDTAAEAASNQRTGRARFRLGRTSTGRFRKLMLGPKPPARLSIRHYRWWPLARIERVWSRLTDPVAWKDPHQRGGIYSSASHSQSHPYPHADQQLGDEHYQDDVQPGLVWSRGIAADLKLNMVHWIVLCLVYIGWILGFSFLAKSLWYESAVVGFDGVSRSPAFLSCTSTYWLRNAECGLDGQDCTPFYTPSGQVGQPFRCPADCIDVTLLNPRAVGDQLVNYEPLVVGGGDVNRTYRGDSFICAAAIHAGIIDNRKGGCGSVRLDGSYAGFSASKANGIDSIGFDSVFPLAYRFESTQGDAQCTDRRWQGYVLNTIMTALVGFVLRPKRIVWFWTLACVGFWHINLVSYPRGYPPPIGAAAGDFLPYLFTCYAIWRLTVRFVWFAFEGLVVEGTFWTLGFWWLGVLLNVVFDKVPIQRLVARDIRQQPGSLIAVIVIAVVVLVIAVNQLRVMWKTGWLGKYLSLYIVGGILIGLAAAVPGETLRLHHYIIALVLLPACAFPTRLCLVYVAFLFGMFTNGVARWSFDGLLQDNAVVQGDATGGTGTPTFNTTALTWAASDALVRWNDIPSNQTHNWDGYALLVDDVLRYQGAGTSWNLSGIVDVFAQEREDDGEGVGNDCVSSSASVPLDRFPAAAGHGRIVDADNDTVTMLAAAVATKNAEVAVLRVRSDGLLSVRSSGDDHMVVRSVAWPESCVVCAVY
ncbi:hypothetical protein PHSY_001977 [Pseudozyma hubeiensis SY62]|uniref:LCCL domain-containing protein n=1 Tax=Pseudozyma hubeiensis (strain SY62) TaxID=1305764 RepID=R9NZY7_PSEHS|nr:hypothetical protein PHSY_001977 [Pseudozyma hubeiensis SY62]GAC94406.1 hypothetical protein PHSY_001977 [Pseudozyma hubeiensis SY62]